MRCVLLLAALALAATATAAAAAPSEVGDALEQASRVLLPPRDGAVGHAVHDALAPPDPVVPQAAGPRPPAKGAPALGAEALLWVLGAGGFAASVGLGWRHVHARNVREHPQRAAILALLRAQPGLHVHGIARATGQPVQQAAYHLHMLERLGCVRSQTLGGRRRYLEAGAAPEVRRALREAAMEPGDQARRVLAFVGTHPGASQSEVARALGMLPGSARWHLQRLAAQGWLEAGRDGRAHVYRPPRGAPGAGGPAGTLFPPP